VIPAAPTKYPPGWVESRIQLAYVRLHARAAFTLIELLVVIGIIAILAAILFPVFARARQAGYRVSGVASLKQTATAIILYSTDSDDCLPNAVPMDGNGVARGRTTVAIPAGWDYAEFEEGDAQVWANSIQPYMRSYAPLAAPGIGTYRYIDTDFVPPFHPPYGEPDKVWNRKTRRDQWFNSSYTFNGLLSTYPSASIAEPSRLTLVWQGEGQAVGEGYANVAPILRCESEEAVPCRFNPSGPPQAGERMPYGFADYWWTGPQADPGVSFRVYGTGMLYASADTSAKWRPNGSAKDSTGDRPRVRSYDDPFSAYDGDGRPRGMWSCSTNKKVYYRAFFRPDTTFEYEFTSDADCRIK